MIKCWCCEQYVQCLEEDRKVCRGCWHGHYMLKKLGGAGYWEPKFIDGIVYE